MNEHRRLNEIYNRLNRLSKRPEILLSCPGSPAVIVGKKRNFLNLDDDAIRTRQGQPVRFSDDCVNADIVLLNNYGQASDIHRYLQQRHYQGVFCLWMHDNHTGTPDKVAAGCDLYFPCHFVNLDSMVNPHSLQGPVLVDYCRNIPLDQTRKFLETHPAAGRQDRVVAQYFMYENIDRNRLLYRITHDEIFRCFYSAESERHLYSGLETAERCRRWGDYKASIVVPVNRDISIRIVDGLAWGHTMMVSDEIDGFDLIFPPSLQAELGIVRYAPGSSVSELAIKAQQCLTRYNQDGEGGVWRRHEFANAHHRYEHRLSAIVDFCIDLGTGRENIQIVTRPVTGYRSERRLLSP
jgi:hypothetical protein